MNSRISIISRKIIFLLFLFSSGWLVSCGLRTAPHNLPEAEAKPRSTFTDLKVQQLDKRIRLSWIINETERAYAFSKWYEDPYDNESERSEIFGQANIHYQMLKARLPKTGVDVLSKWFEDNYDNNIERNEALSMWYKDQYDNGTEKTDAFNKLDTNQNLQDYFLIQEQKLKIGCRDCEIEKMPALRILFSSNSFIREGKRLYYYLDLPKNDLNLREYEVSHLGPDDEILSPVQTVKFRQSNLFPKVPVPNLQLVQIEDENQIMRFAFGKVVLKKITVVDDEPEKLLEQKKDKAENPETFIPNKQQQIESRTFVLKLSWPILSYKGSKRLKGKGDYFEGQEYFKVNLYRTLSGEDWPETPINVKTIPNNHYLDRPKYFIPPATYPHMTDTHPDISPPKLSFYIDLHGQKRDTWLYNLRLVDRFGNESAASETIKFQSLETMILGQNFGQKIFVPLSD